MKTRFLNPLNLPWKPKPRSVPTLFPDDGEDESDRDDEFCTPTREPEPRKARSKPPTQRRLKVLAVLPCARLKIP